MARGIRILVDSRIPYFEGVLEQAADVNYMPGEAIGPEHVKDADALVIRTRTVCNRELLEGSSVRFIATAAIGYDHIDTDYCRRKGIEWTNAPGCNSSSVAQYMLSALLAYARVKNSRLCDYTIGIVGVGHVGSKVERICRAMGMKVLLNDPPRARREGGRGFVSLERIMGEADVITFHVPLTHEGRDVTRHLAGKDFFSGLTRRVLLINTARGGVVDSEALKQALYNQRCSGVILDVFEGEPSIDAELLRLCSIATPHIAGYSADGKATGTSMSVQAVSRFFGLGLDDWYPSGLPVPERPVIDADGRGRQQQEVLSEVVLKTYDVMRDDAALRRHPERFEQLRAGYPVRREPGAYNVSIAGDDAGSGKVLEQFGYHVTNINELTTIKKE